MSKKILFIFVTKESDLVVNWCYQLNIFFILVMSAFWRSLSEVIMSPYRLLKISLNSKRSGSARMANSCKYNMLSGLSESSGFVVQCNNSAKENQNQINFHEK